MYGDGEGTVWDRVGRPHRDCMCYLGPPTLMPILTPQEQSLPLSILPSVVARTEDQWRMMMYNGMRKSHDVSPRRLSDISPQLRQLKYLVVDDAIKEDLKSSRSVEDINSASIEERILRITGYYGYQPWNASYKRFEDGEMQQWSRLERDYVRMYTPTAGSNRPAGRDGQGVCRLR
ncbi:hypothetical protein EYF80_027976 [Liparis tanakae]|uniref:Uncharacterized protein n=1 Tax=Liparis tanakae TaxID=230148 RepID=A0A4Z2HA43_9TELE|nr:hypothetical protein EYF80_027976 [Liparis tanakae]